jgi:hypothetical protein
MLDLEQTLKELGSFVKRLTDDKEENIQQILKRNMDGYVQDSTCGVVHHDLHNGGSWFGQQLVILCIPPLPWLNDYDHDHHDHLYFPILFAHCIFVYMGIYYI